MRSSAFYTGFMLNLSIGSLNCREGLVTFCLDTKSNQKNQVSRKGFLAALGLALQIRQNRGCNLLPRWRYAHAQPFYKKLLCPAAALGHHCFA
jgi:hypothetical protein